LGGQAVTRLPSGGGIVAAPFFVEPSMTRLSTLATCAALALMAASITAQAQQAYPATLAGHAVLPAQTVIAAPPDAPQDLQASGKFTTARRVDAVGTVMGQSGGRSTGVSLPFQGQPIQGHSGIKRMADGSFWILTDNGAGSKANSPDFMLHLSHYGVDFASGQFQRRQTVFLHDPDKKVPFRITHEGTEKRYLTGADFDPVLIKADLKGKCWRCSKPRWTARSCARPTRPAC
jgi:hypothetical protein